MKCEEIESGLRRNVDFSLNILSVKCDFEERCRISRSMHPQHWVLWAGEKYFIVCNLSFSTRYLFFQAKSGSLQSSFPDFPVNHLGPLFQKKTNNNKKKQSSSPSLEILILCVWYGARKFRFLTSATRDSSYQRISLGSGTPEATYMRITQGLIKI